MTKQRMLQKTLINDLMFRMLRPTSSEVMVRYNRIKFKCYGERLEPNLKEMTIVKKMIIYRPI